MSDESAIKCKRCLLLQSGGNEVFEDIFQRIKKIPGDKKTPSHIYETRLSFCKSCDFLLNGTCLKCGCYPEFRAAFTFNHCPIKNW